MNVFDVEMDGRFFLIWSGSGLVACGRFGLGPMRAIL
jgi:hypothetical protein